MKGGFFRKVLESASGMLGGSPAVGIDIGSHSVKAVALKKERGGGFSATAGEAFYADLFADGDDPRRAVEPLSLLAGDFGLRGAAAAVSVSGASVFAGGVPYSGGSPEEAVSARLSALFPEGADGCVSDFCVSGDVAHMAVAKTAAVRGRVSALRSCGLVPHIVDYDGFAVVNSRLRSRPESEGAAVLLNVGRSVTNLAVLDGAKTVLTRDLPCGSGEVTLAMASAGDMTADEAEVKKMSLGADSMPDFIGAAREFSLKLAREARATLDVFVSPEYAPSAIEISGGGALLYGLADALEETLGAEARLSDPLKGLCDGAAEISAKCAVATGLALRVAK